MVWQTMRSAYLSNTWPNPSFRNYKIYLVASDYKSIVHIKERQKASIKTNNKKTTTKKRQAFTLNWANKNLNEKKKKFSEH